MTQTQPAGTAVVAKLSTLDQLLPVWIGAAKVVGLAAGRWIPALGPFPSTPQEAPP